MVRNDTAALLRHPRFPKRLLTVAVASCFAGAPAWALDANNLTAVTGAFTASQNGSVLTLTTTTDRTLAEAQQRFNVLANEQLRVLQPSSSSLFLLRVVPGAGGVLERSVIDGSIYSNGQFWLQNAAGALIGKGAVIDTAGFLATSMAVRLEDFMAARLTSLTGVAGAGDVINQGTIKTSSGGSVYLVGANVSNEGLIETPGGETILAAGQTVNLIDTGTPGVKVEVTAAAGNATNLGEIVATAGRIGMAGVIVKNSGTLNASSVVSEGGRIFLKASKDAYVDGAGRIVATGTKGGKVDVLGERVAVMDQAQIDASGGNGGGTVLVGGDYQGKNPDVPNATVTYFGKDASIKADATDDGDGGKVIVWADDTTRAYGNISVRGATNGGFIETSGHSLDVGGIRVNMAGATGANGTWLLDPSDITIVHGGGVGSLTAGVFDPAGASGSISDDVINSGLTSGNVTIQTTSGTGGTGNITINGTADGGGAAQIANSSTFGRTLTLTAAANIDMHAGASISGDASSTLGVTFNAGGGVKLDTGAAIYTYGGNVSMTGTGTAGYTAGMLLNGASIDAGTGSVSLTGTGYVTGGIGVNLTQSSVLANGGITVAGTGRGNGGFLQGIKVEGAGGAGYSLKSAGNISLTGTSTSVGGSVSVGVLVTNGGHVEATGSGNITMTGVGGGSGGTQNHGVLINGTPTSKVLAANGNITLTGTAGDSAVGTMGVGIGGFNSYVEITGSGSVAINAITPTGGLETDFKLYSSGTNGIRTNGGSIGIKANNVDLTSGMINAGSGAIKIEPYAASSQIQLGNTAADAVNQMGLTDAELARIATTGSVTIGSATTGNVTVVGSLNLAGLPNGGLVLASGNDIAINSSLGSSSISITHSDSWGNWTNTQSGYSSAYGLSLLASHAVNINAWTGNAGTGAINIMAGWDGASTTSPVLNAGFTAAQSININSGGGIASKGAVSLSAVDGVYLNAGASSAGIDLDSGALSITANSLTLSGGTANNASARISTNASQTYTTGTYNNTGGVKLTGSNTAGVYGGSAEIALYGTAGTQSFTIQNGSSVELKGGGANGYMPASGTGNCSTGAICSNNGASIRTNGYGGQSFTFSTGGKLNVYGGYGGNSNSGHIENRGTGAQTVTAGSGTVNISLYGGTSGGTTTTYGGKVETLENSASIESEYASQSITAGILYLEGGTAEYGGAYLTGKTQSITAGALTMNGGSLGGHGSAPSAYDTYGADIWYNPVVIGHDTTNTINLSLGTLTMNGGVSSSYGGSGALIGGYRVASTVTINSSGAVQLNSANQWSDRIGSLGGYGGSVTLSTTTGSIALGKAYIGTGSTGSVTVNGYGGVTQDVLGRIETNTLTASATNTLMDVSLTGENKANYVSITAPDMIDYKSVASTHVSSMTSTGSGGAHTITVNVTNPYGYGGTVGLGTLSSTNGTVTVNAAQQILDDNGTGTGNISAQGITLLSTNGTTDSGGIAISADVVMTGGARTISATVNNTATYGGISIRNGGSLAPLSTGMTDQSTTSGHAELTYVSAYDIDMTTGAYNLSSNRGGATLGTTGNLTLSSLATLLPGINDANYRYIKLSGQNVATSTSTALVSTPDLYINANGTLTIAAANNITAARNVGLNAVGGLTVSGSSVSASANVYLGGVNKYGGGAITLTGSAVTAGNGIYAYTGGDIRLNNGSSLVAAYDVNLGLGGTSSTVYLNDTTGYSDSYIQSGGAYATNIGFLTRSSDGVVIDGATTMTSAAYGSGIFRGFLGTPATAGAGLTVIYGLAASAAVTRAVTDVVNTITTTTTTASNSVSSGSTTTSTANIPPPTTTTTTTSGGITSLSSGTVGGAAGQFGDTASSAGSTATTTTTSTTTSTSGTTTSGSTTSTTSGTTSGDTSSSTGSTTTAGDSGSGSTSTSNSTSSGDSANGSKDAKEEKKEEKKDDKSKKADSGEKKDDKAKSKPVGKCSA